MIKKSLINTCLICKEKIHTQMCQNCLSESMSTWMYVKDQALKSKKLKELNKYINSLIEKNPEDNKGIICISCEKRNLEVCPACFARLIQGKMEDLNIDRELISEFRKVFWFNGKEKSSISKDNNIFISNSISVI